MAARAFTLIELLVVISIIAILAGMLMSGIGQVRTSAKSSACMSNQRQILTAALVWGQEHEDLLMPAIWATALASNHSRYGNTLYSLDMQAVNFRCPAYRGTAVVTLGENMTIPWAGTGPGTSGDNIWPWGAGDQYYWVKGNTTIATVRSVSEKVYFGDSSGDLLAYWNTTLPGGRRHQGKANLAWIDGHASVEPFDYATAGTTGKYFNSP